MRHPDDSIAHALIAVVSKTFQPPEGTAARVERFTSLEEARATAPDLLAIDLELLATLQGACPAREQLILLVDSADTLVTATSAHSGAHAVLDRTSPATFAALALDAAMRKWLELCEHHRAQRQLALLRGDSEVGFWELDLATGSFWCSPEFGTLLGIDDRRLPTDLHAAIASLPECERERASKWFQDCARDGEIAAFEHATPSGVRVRHVAQAFSGADGASLRVTGMVEEVHVDRPRVGGSMWSVAQQADESASFLAQAEHAVRIAARTGQHVALLHIDVQRVSALTANALSTDAADALLDGIAQRIREATRDGDTVGRIDALREACVVARSGEHFNVLLPDLARIHDAAKVATRILDTFAKPFTVSGHELCVPAAIGIAGYPTDHNAVDELVRRAETASFCARQSGHGALKFYSAELDARAFERLTLETSLRRALERNELCLYYQPRVAVDGERIVGFEALLRWKHPDLGFVSPAQFIPLAEETGLIVPIGEWVLREACRQAKAWQDAGATPVRMAVNLSTVQFTQPNLPQVVRDALASSGLAADWLELELTESTVMRDAGAAVETLARLKAAGVHLSIDDFGTGYSSLAYLKRFPIDALKIDQSFIRESTTNPDDAAIVTSILLMAKSLKLGVVAEGVETASQLAFLRVLQCDEVQGYLFSPPVPPERALGLLERGFEAARAA